jgi:hypothetical protein
MEMRCTGLPETTTEVTRRQAEDYIAEEDHHHSMKRKE